MFEHWSEPRRRWFLITFVATAWALFANSVSLLGSEFADGGIGPDAFHAAAICGSVATWTVVWSMFRLELRHWVFAVLCGLSLNAALVDFGLRDQAAAGVWDLACWAGEGTACRNLAAHYAGGNSVLGGGADAQRLHRRACALGGSQIAKSCDAARSEPVQTSLEALCDEGIASACVDAAHQHESMGDFATARQLYAKGCGSVRKAAQLIACEELLDSGIHAARLDACDTVERVCRTSSSRHCFVSTKRCERARAPYAGVGP